MYNEKHQLFLNYLLKIGFSPVNKAIEYCSKCDIDDVNNIETLKTIVTRINKRIVKQCLHICIARCEITGDPFVMITNTSNDEISKHQVLFKPIELEYFQILVKEIVTAEDKKIDQMNCLNISSTLSGKLHISDAEILLNKWISMGYLITHDEAIHLGIRCINEFSVYFQTQCKDYVQNCSLCSELVFLGKTCGPCKKTMHTYCIDKFLSQSNVCPNCKKEWNARNSDGNSSRQKSMELTAEETSEEDEDDAPRQRRKRKS